VVLLTADPSRGVGGKMTRQPGIRFTAAGIARRRLHRSTSSASCWTSTAPRSTASAALAKASPAAR